MSVPENSAGPQDVDGARHESELGSRRRHTTRPDTRATPDDHLFRITKYGVAQASNLKDYDSAMPAFEGALTNAEIVAVLSWIKAQWPPEIRKHRGEINAESLLIE